MGGRNPRYSNGAARRKLRAWWRAQGLPCAICGQPIDYDLPARHPLSFEVDEIVPVSLGGSPLSRENTQPAHRICNERKGASPPGAPVRLGCGTPVETTREW